MPAAPTRGWRATAQAVLLHWSIDAVFAAPSGGRSIHSNCNALLTSAMSAARSEEWPGFWRTVGRVLKALGLGRLKNLQPAEPVRRYQWARPGDMIHVDTKQLARFERVGHRITGDRRQGSSRGADYEKSSCGHLRRHATGLRRGAAG